VPLGLCYRSLVRGHKRTTGWLILGFVVALAACSTSPTQGVGTQASALPTGENLPAMSNTEPTGSGFISSAEPTTVIVPTPSAVTSGAAPTAVASVVVQPPVPMPSGAGTIEAEVDASGGEVFDGGAGSTSANVQLGGGDAGQVSYQRDVQPIWDKYCNECHNFHTPHLVGAASWSMLDGAVSQDCNQLPFVVPGKPEASFLYAKLTGVIDPSAASYCRRPMPANWMTLGDTPLVELDEPAVRTVQQWIVQGALNN
jgi:hypothetical protein